MNDPDAVLQGEIAVIRLVMRGRKLIAEKIIETDAKMGVRIDRMEPTEVPFSVWATPMGARHMKQKSLWIWETTILVNDDELKTSGKKERLFMSDGYEISFSVPVSVYDIA